MAELNKIMLIGRLTKDPDLRYTPGGMAVVKLRMAVNHTRYVGKPGEEKREKKQEVLFIDVSVFGRSAETVKQYTSKGRELFIEGRLQQDEWTDKQGQKRISYGVIADTFQFLGGGRQGGERETTAEEGGGSGPAETYDAGDAPSRSEAHSAPNEKVDDLPF
jgi:single-strand DNA-binding protein